MCQCLGHSHLSQLPLSLFVFLKTEALILILLDCLEAHSSLPLNCFKNTGRGRPSLYLYEDFWKEISG